MRPRVPKEKVNPLVAGVEEEALVAKVVDDDDAPNTKGGEEVEGVGPKEKALGTALGVSGGGGVVELAAANTNREVGDCETFCTLRCAFACSTAKDESGTDVADDADKVKASNANSIDEGTVGTGGDEASSPSLLVLSSIPSLLIFDSPCRATY